MKHFGMSMIETAVTGVIGLGDAGIASRCAQCYLARRHQGPCGGFGEGCLVKRDTPSAEPSKEKFHSSMRRWVRA